MTVKTYIVYLAISFLLSVVIILMKEASIIPLEFMLYLLGIVTGQFGGASILVKLKY